MEYRITTAHTPPRVFLYSDAERACRKVRTLERTGVAFTVTDSVGAVVGADRLRPLHEAFTAK